MSVNQTQPGLAPLPTDPRISNNGTIASAYQAWFQSIQKWCSPLGQSGPTTARPTKNLYVGQVFFDTTLHYPVWVNTVGPPVVWHDGAGNAV